MLWFAFFILNLIATLMTAVNGLGLLYAFTNSPGPTTPRLRWMSDVLFVSGLILNTVERRLKKLPPIRHPEPRGFRSFKTTTARDSGIGG